MCLHSLLVASEKIANNKGSVNGHLFLIKHLLIIREQTTPFRGSCSVTEGSIDLHKVKDSVWTLLQHKSRWFSLTNNALLDFLLQAPANVNDCTIDGRRIVDLQLRDACQNLINDCSRDLTKDLEEFLEKLHIKQFYSGILMIILRHRKIIFGFKCEQLMPLSKLVCCSAGQCFQKVLSSNRYKLRFTVSDLYVNRFDILAESRRNIESHFDDQPSYFLPLLLNVV
uniref:Conserved oligomeric Golgi complex subunit 3 n=1 Tax=Romanomermis culicivorax TaxID=13658 RepID=A0A915J7V6_ROMCU